MKISKILCCVDNDPLAESVFEFGFEIAQKLGADVALLSVLNQNLLQTGESGVDVWTLQNSLKHEMDQLFERLLKKKENPNIAKFYEEGDPKNLIVEIANNWNADLIVIASHGRKGIRRVLMGSVAESVLRYAKCPVLVIPAHTK